MRCLAVVVAVIEVWLVVLCGRFMRGMTCLKMGCGPEHLHTKGTAVFHRIDCNGTPCPHTKAGVHFPNDNFSKPFQKPGVLHKPFNHGFRFGWPSRALGFTPIQVLAKDLVKVLAKSLMQT
jgi:hypothetical protein